MRVRVSELEVAALCYHVTMLEMPELVWGETIGIHHASDQVVVPNMDSPDCYSPFTSWKMFGPIIERENITIIRANSTWDGKRHQPSWFAETSKWVGHGVREGYEGQYFDPCFMVGEDDGYYGRTPLIAAMRCYIASKMGVEVEVPDGLIKGE